MSKRIKVSLVILGLIIVVYSFMAFRETAILSYNTVDEAFNDFLVKIHGIEDRGDKELGEIAHYEVNNYVFVAYLINNNLSLAQFEKGKLGWQWGNVSNNMNANESSKYTKVDHLKNEIIMYGIIPEKIIEDVQQVKVDSFNANIISLNEKIGLWILVSTSNIHSINNINIEYLSSSGNAIQF